MQLAIRATSARKVRALAAMPARYATTASEERCAISATLPITGAGGSAASRSLTCAPRMAGGRLQAHAHARQQAGPMRRRQHPAAHGVLADEHQCNEWQRGEIGKCRPDAQR